MPGTKFLMTMDLTTQGKLVGSITRKKGDPNFSQGMECHGFEYEIVTQIDAGIGQLVGKRTHKPIVIKKEVDSASPLLFQALVTNEVFKSAVLTQQPITVTKGTNSASPNLLQGLTTNQNLNPATPTQKPITVTKANDSASPLLFQHAVTNPAFRFPLPKFDNTVKPSGPLHIIELINGAIIGIRPAGIVGGKRCEAVTVTYESLKVDGMLNGTIPRSVLG